MILTEIPQTTSYFWKQSRSATYSDWPFNDSQECNAERLATAGFYVVADRSDLVECFMCRTRFGSWKPNYDPWSKHVKYQSNCPFVRLNRQNEKEWTMEDLLYLCSEYQRKINADGVNRAEQKNGQEMISTQIIFIQDVI